MAGLQEWIHTLEEGRGARVIKVTFALFGFVALALLYDFRCFKNFYAPEAMDAAQLARNISEGKGYTTLVVRPLSIHLLQEHRADRDALLKTAHPDLANPPVYPTVLAGLFKITPVSFEIASRKTFVTYQPERWIAALNQLLFFLALFLLFRLASRLFDQAVAWVSVLVLVGAELFWRFSVSGLSTMLLLVIFLAIVSCLVRMDEWQREDAPPDGKLLGYGILTGLLIGVTALTRYSFLWLIFPVLLFVALFAPRFRIKMAMAILIPFLVVLTPWIARNISVSGTPFGTSTYVICEQTGPFTEDTLQRSLKPDENFGKLTINNFVRKLLVNGRAILQNDLPKLGGSWVTAFFLAGLLMPFRNPTLSRLRIFLLSSLALFVVVQAWGRTNLSDASLEVNSENLLVIFAPLVFLYGVGFYFILLQQIDLPTPALRPAISGLFVTVLSAPLIFALLPPRSYPYAYPPYLPPVIHGVSSWMKEKELMMSDVPSAVAWYGGRQCSSLTLDYEKEFFAINDDIKPVQALYLSPQAMDSRFLSQMLRPMTTIKNQKTWERFLFESLSRGEVIGGFPLKKMRFDMLPDHFFLTDWERWKGQGQW